MGSRRNTRPPRTCPAVATREARSATAPLGRSSATPWLVLVLTGSDSPSVSARHRHVRIAHIRELDAVDGIVFDRDFRKRDEQKFTHASL
jgi:hypothetical protein